MTEPTSATTTPNFRVHARAPAFVRAAVVAALCAALTAGFLAQVFGGPSARSAQGDAQMAACSDAPTGDPC